MFTKKSQLLSRHRMSFGFAFLLCMLGVVGLSATPAFAGPENPCIRVDKFCQDASGPGQPIEFNGTVTNCGAVDLSNVMVVDDNDTGTFPILGPITLTRTGTTKSMDYLGSYVPITSPSTDTVTATGMFGSAIFTAQASATCDILTQEDPCIEVTKKCQGPSASDEPVQFGGTVRNCGDALSNVTLVDFVVDVGSQVIFSGQTLGLGGEISYTGDYIAPASSHGSESTDTVTATGTTAGGAVASDQASATCDIPLPVVPCIEVTKQCQDASAHDQPITFGGTVRNCGDVALSDVTVVDFVEGGGPVLVVDGIALNPTESTGYGGAYDPTVSPSTDRVRATGVTVDAKGVTVTDFSEFRTCTVPPPPGSDGCTPGYWKNHLDQWAATGYSPADNFYTIFGVSWTNPKINTLGDAINAKGGGVKKLARHGTAALLSAAHPGVTYPLTVAQVIQAVQNGNADLLAGFNELGCPIN